MKKLLMSLSLCLIASCATTIPDKPMYSNLSIKNIENICQPVEQYRLGILSMPALFLRFNNCAKVKDFTMIITPVPDFKEEIRDISARIIILHYIDFLNRDNEKSNNKNQVWKSTYVKRELNVDDERNQEIFYYVLSSHLVKQNLKK